MGGPRYHRVTVGFTDRSRTDPHPHVAAQRILYFTGIIVETFKCSLKVGSKTLRMILRAIFMGCGLASSWLRTALLRSRSFGRPALASSFRLSLFNSGQELTTPPNSGQKNLVELVAGDAQTIVVVTAPDNQSPLKMSQLFSQRKCLR